MLESRLLTLLYSKLGLYLPTLTKEQLSLSLTSGSIALTNLELDAEGEEKREKERKGEEWNYYLHAARKEKLEKKS